MKVAELLQSRHQNWRELERLCYEMERLRWSADQAETVTRFAALYRACCADLALADAYQLPPNTVTYLHHLVGRAHNQLYRSRKFNMSSWAGELLYNVPQRLYKDNCLRLAFFLFWGIFLSAAFLAALSSDFAEQVIPKEMLTSMDQMHADSVGGGVAAHQRIGAAGFYVDHNATIGLRCFVLGLFLGIGGLFETASNALVLGTIFGHMTNSPARDNFFQFVTAHGPFELTAVVLCAATGMRLGFSIIQTNGYSRRASLRLAVDDAIPTACVAIVLFCLAAVIEAFLSPSAAPYWIKAFVAVLSSGLMMFYFVMLGYPRSESRAA